MAFSAFVALRQCTVLAGLSLALSTGSISAASISAFSGNTQPSHSPAPGVGGTVDFAVYNHTGGTAGDTFDTGFAGFNALFTAGVGSGAFDTSAQYLYLFETVNNGPYSASFPISQNSVGVTGSRVTSFGGFTSLDFSTKILGTAAGFAEPSGHSTGATPIIAATAGSSFPLVLDGSSSLKALFTTELNSGQESILWGYTSNYGPAFGNTGIVDGGTTADGSVPTAAVVPTSSPEPSAIALFGLGGTLIGIRRLRFRKA